MSVYICSDIDACSGYNDSIHKCIDTWMDFYIAATVCHGLLLPGAV